MPDNKLESPQDTLFKTIHKKALADVQLTRGQQSKQQKTRQFMIPNERNEANSGPSGKGPDAGWHIAPILVMDVQQL